MSMLINASTNQAVTMTSLELVEFINSQRKEGESVLTHADFMKKVPKVLGEKDAGLFSDIYADAYGRQQRCYVFPKREACLMAMSYSYELQAVVYDRMTALEAKAVQTFSLPNFADPAEAAVAWAAEYRAKQQAITERDQLQQQVIEYAPQVEALRTLANSTGFETIDQAAHALGVAPRKTLRPWMIENKWIYQDKQGLWRAYAHRVEQGVLAEKDRTYSSKSGNQKHTVTVYVTPKGKTLMATRLQSNGGR